MGHTQTKVFEKTNGKVLHEFWCSDCQGYISVKLNHDRQGVHCVICPKCQHNHYRVITDGVITDDRAPDGAKSYADEICPTMAAYSKESWEQRMLERRKGAKQEDPGGFLARAWSRFRDVKIHVAEKPKPSTPKPMVAPVPQVVPPPPSHKSSVEKEEPINPVRPSERPEFKKPEPEKVIVSVSDEVWDIIVQLQQSEFESNQGSVSRLQFVVNHAGKLKEEAVRLRNFSVAASFRDIEKGALDMFSALLASKRKTLTKSKKVKKTKK